MSYIVPPGLYALGYPDSSSPVVVTANYKMTYDLVRGALANNSVWLLVLETYGINVWCAAGKGTFGTGELVRRVASSRLAEVVSHRELILPLLGAAGVKGSDVKKRSGFNVRFSTIRIEDLPHYLQTGSVGEGARELTFTAFERLILTPVEITAGVRKAFPLMLLLFVAAGFSSGDFDLQRALVAVLAYLTALLAGACLSPLLLPWLPSPSFAFKGAVTGAFAGAGFCLPAGVSSPVNVTALVLMITAVSSFLMLNFTGSTPYTSRSGVKKEMRWALPLQAISLLAGVLLIITGRFF
jgi:acetyl-CoA decarbonylase/synthase complex subunit gamma